MSGYQDWATVVLRKSTATKPVTVKSTETVSHPNQQKTSVSHKVEDGDVTPVKTFSKEFGLKVQQARAAKGWNQKQLATQINKQVSLINDIERGLGVYDGLVVDKLNRVLGLVSK